MIQKLKFKKLLSEYKSLDYEIQMIKEVLKDAHMEFESYYRRWCAEKDVDLQQLNKNNLKRVEMNFATSETGLSVVEPPKPKKDKHKDIYRSLAKKIHPDKLDSYDSNYWRDYMDFKDATSAMTNENWGKLFEIADRQDVHLKDYDSICKDMEEDIERLRSKIEKEKSSYSWKLYECESEECKENLVRSFLFQLFRWRE